MVGRFVIIRVTCVIEDGEGVNCGVVCVVLCGDRIGNRFYF